VSVEGKYVKKQFVNPSITRFVKAGKCPRSLRARTFANQIRAKEHMP